MLIFEVPQFPVTVEYGVAAKVPAGDALMFGMLEMVTPVDLLTKTRSLPICFITFPAKEAIFGSNPVTVKGATI